MSRSPRSTAVLLLLPPLILGALGWRHRWMSEDAFIVLRVVRNVLDGHGPIWNLHERVEIYTSPLWLGALSLVGAVVPSARLEWIAVAAGLLGAVCGLFAAERGALLIAGERGPRPIALPLGGLVVAALPPCWDYATSGLETGLVFAWLGGCFWGLARALPRERRDPPHVDRAPLGAAAVAAAIGLGPLVRPDLAIMAAGFLACLVWICRPMTLRRLFVIGAAAAVIPTAYQVFRLGYFATLVPNTALAKEAFGVYWGQGWRYLVDFAGTYWLWVPGIALAAPWIAALGSGLACRSRAVAILVTPVACGILHALYVVRLGGDFMHARLLLPSLFSLLLPVSMVAAHPWRRAAPPALIVVPWALVCALALRVPYPETIGAAGIADERGLHVAAARYEHPVTVEAYDRTYVIDDGRALRRLAGRSRALLLGDEITAAHPDPPAMPLAPSVKASVVAARPNVGLLGYAAGGRVHIVDRLGLGDPLAARLRVDRRGRPGHEKWLTDAWTAARFADPAASLPAGAPPPAAVAAARAALACPPLSELLQAIEAPLTVSQFARNMASAWRLRRLAIPPDPVQAVSVLCATP